MCNKFINIFMRELFIPLYPKHTLKLTICILHHRMGEGGGSSQCFAHCQKICKYHNLVYRTYLAEDYVGIFQPNLFCFCCAK
jgi:hypothetical protein